MAGSTFGCLFTVSTWGESHGKGLGVVVDGCPAGLPLCEADIQKYLNRRKPGQNTYSTARREGDQVEILSGIFEGRTTGSPISMLVFNKDQRSGDYGNLAKAYRPGHADFTFDSKFGFRDYRGGGRSSGRETIGRVAGGAVAVRLLEEFDIRFTSYVKSIGPITAETFDRKHILSDPLYMPDPAASSRAQAYLRKCMDALDSAGGLVECLVDGLPAGLGSPVFGKLDAILGQALFSIGAVKAVEIGDGIAVTTSKGSQNNDGFAPSKDGGIQKTSNHSGGIMGGISDGEQLVLRAHFKPTPSIARCQHTVDQKGQPIELSIQGRHDPIIAPRAVVVVEAMTALTLADALLCSSTSRLDQLKKIWS